LAKSVTTAAIITSVMAIATSISTSVKAVRGGREMTNGRNPNRPTFGILSFLIASRTDG
jgi:hypothetical protein